MDKAKVGSETAKGGFANEVDIVNKFNNWESDFDARKWLKIMGYSIIQIKEVQAIRIPLKIKEAEYIKYGVNDVDYYTLTKFKKADAQVKLTIKIGDIIKIENISIKKANLNANFNQIDKRPVMDYQKMWGFDTEIKKYLELFTGAERPVDNKAIINYDKLRNKKRIFLDELEDRQLEKIISFFSNNRIMIVSDILKGRGGLSANWIIFTQYNKTEDITIWKLVDINIAMNFFGSGDVKISPRGSLLIGKIFMQRKGGTPDPTSLQFKFHPLDIFKME